MLKNYSAHQAKCPCQEIKNLLNVQNKTEKTNQRHI